MIVHVRYLSAIRDETGKRLDELSLPEGSTLTEVAAWVLKSYGIAAPDPALMCTLNGHGWNQAPQGMATKVHEGDEIALFPLLSGG